MGLQDWEVPGFPLMCGLGGGQDSGRGCPVSAARPWAFKPRPSWPCSLLQGKEGGCPVVVRSPAGPELRPAPPLTWPCVPWTSFFITLPTPSLTWLVCKMGRCVAVAPSGHWIVSRFPSSTLETAISVKCTFGTRQALVSI